MTTFGRWRLWDGLRYIYIYFLKMIKRCIFVFNKVIYLKDKLLWLESGIETSYQKKNIAKNNVRAMKVENHDTTKLGNQHENLLKRELQRMWTNSKLCLSTYMYFLILQLLYVYCVYLPITKLLKILIYSCFESFPFRQDFVIFVRQITWFRWINRHWTYGVNAQALV